MSAITGRRQEDYLIELTAAAVGQREAAKSPGHPSWGWIYKMSDYHDVANLVYYKIMWYDSPGLIPWKEKFQARYRRAIRFQELYRELRSEIEAELENAGIHSVFMGESAVLEFYPQTEMRMPEPIQILIEKKRMDDTRRIMFGMDFEETVSEDGVHIWKYTQSPELTVMITDSLPFSGKKIRNWFTDFPKMLPCENNRHYIHCMNEETLYVYFICRLAEKYARGQIEIRDIVDLWLLISREGPEMKWKDIGEELENMELDTFGEYIAKLAGKWFSNMYFRGDMEMLGDMQDYIFSKGETARRENEAILPLVRTVADNYYRDLKKEEKKRWRSWLFPSLEYMTASYPRLSKRPFLLPAYWMIRIIKRKMFSRKEREKEENQKEES